MPKRLAQEEEVQLEVKKSRKYRSITRIRFQWLYFPWNELDEPDVENVERFKKTIIQNCRQFDARNHILEIVSQSDLNNAIQIAESFTEALFNSASNDYPELVFPPGFRLECLHGRHRILAAKEALHSLNKWWTVDFYLFGMLLRRSEVDFVLIRTDISDRLKIWLTEEYSNEKRPGAGDIYRKIRQYHFKKILNFEVRWRTWLNKGEAKNLARLLLRREWTAAFDDLLDILGLWGGMLISTLHTAMDIKCDLSANFTSWLGEKVFLKIIHFLITSYEFGYTG